MIWNPYSDLLISIRVNKGDQIRRYLLWRKPILKIMRPPCASPAPKGGGGVSDASLLPLSGFRHEYR